MVTSTGMGMTTAMTSAGISTRSGISVGRSAAMTTTSAPVSAWQDVRVPPSGGLPVYSIGSRTVTLTVLLRRLEARRFFRGRLSSSTSTTAMTTIGTRNDVQRPRAHAYPRFVGSRYLPGTSARKELHHVSTTRVSSTGAPLQKPLRD